jgi:hypothetical protein
MYTPHVLPIFMYTPHVLPDSREHGFSTNFVRCARFDAQRVLVLERPPNPLKVQKLQYWSRNIFAIFVDTVVNGCLNCEARQLAIFDKA